MISNEQHITAKENALRRERPYNPLSSICHSYVDPSFNPAYAVRAVTAQEEEEPTPEQVFTPKEDLFPLPCIYENIDAANCGADMLLTHSAIISDCSDVLCTSQSDITLCRKLLAVLAASVVMLLAVVAEVVLLMFGHLAIDHYVYFVVCAVANVYVFKLSYEGFLPGPTTMAVVADEKSAPHLP